MLRNGIGDGIYLSAGLLDPVDCLPAQLVGDGELVLRDSGETRGRTTLDASGLGVRVQQRSAAAVRDQREAIASANQAQVDEANWRARFQRARQNLEQIDKNAQSIREQIERADRLVTGRGYELTQESRAQYFQAKERLSRIPAEKAVAEQQLHDLEIEAAHAAVPLEWRR